LKFQAAIIEQKNKLGGVNAAVANNQMIQKQIRVLENRFDKSQLKFNETVAQNKALRHKIDEYRRERVIFDGIYKKLERELHEKKKEMAVIIEDSKVAYMKREEAASEMRKLQEDADKEKAEFEELFTDLGRRIKDNQTMLDNLRLRQFDNPNVDQDITVSTSALNDEDDVTQRTSRDLGMGLLSQERMVNYGAELERLFEVTGSSDVTEIVRKFLELEEQNFSSFNYVNTINSECERLEHAIADIKMKIEKQRGTGMNEDTQRKKQVHELGDKLKKTQTRIEEYERRANTSRKQIAQFKSGILSIHGRIAPATGQGTHETSDQPTEQNMLQYLGIIEQKTTEVLHNYAATQLNITPMNEVKDLKDLHLTVTEKTEDVYNVIRQEVAERLRKDREDEGEDRALLFDGAGGEADDDERPLTRQEVDARYKKKFNNTLIAH
jgi:chromosome segregation ATPase